MRGVWESCDTNEESESVVVVPRSPWTALAPVRAVESGLRFSPGIRGRKTSPSSVPGDMTSHGIPYPWLPLLRREVEDLVRTRHGERYLRERKAWTELAQINRELKLLQAQLAALEERRPTLLPTSPNKVIIKRDRHVGLRDKVDLATPPTGGVPQARRRAAPDRRTHPDPHRSRTTGSSSLRHPPRSGGHGPS
jgi:hypothetical protein